MSESAHFRYPRWFIVDGQYPMLMTANGEWLVIEGNRRKQLQGPEIPDETRRTECSEDEALAMVPFKLRGVLSLRAFAEEIGDMIVKNLNRSIESGTHPEDEEQLRWASRAGSVSNPPSAGIDALPPTSSSKTAEDVALAAWWATKLHAGQVRKGTCIPYISHLFCVSALVMEFGGDREQVIAALLHDAIEDAGGPPVREMIRRTFGRGVEEIVVACTDTDETPKPPWEQRKRTHLSHLRAAGARVLLVAAADKLHNVRSTLEDVRREGLSVYKRFNAPRGADDTLWYYWELASIFIQRDIGPIARTFSDVVNELEKLTRSLEQSRA